MANRSSSAYEPTWVTDQLAVGHAPMSHAALKALHEEGISAILNLCGEFCDLHDIEREAGFEVHYMALEDETAPGLDQLEKALEWLDEAIYLGKKVLIHCRHGIGRTGTVLNAYLLRRGLGHKQAGKALRKLRSKPANFSQWRTVRKYGKQSGQLTIREPSLEFNRLVDLTPFFSDYEALENRAEDLFQYEIGPTGRCGLDNERCCRTPLTLGLVEAVRLSSAINTMLTSEQRLEVINRAMLAGTHERSAVRELGEGSYCLTDGEACPLLEDGKCLLFEGRPLQCRTFEMDEGVKHEFYENVLEPAMRKISRELWFAYAGDMSQCDLPTFSLNDVVSGRFIQTMFHCMRDASG